MLATTVQKWKEELLQEGLQQGLQKGKLEGRYEGLLEGKKEGKLETARKLKQKGMDLAEIAEITGLSPEDLEKL